MFSVWGVPAGESDTRPWGTYLVLADEPTYKVKRITVTPGKRISYQVHAKRSEHWFIVSGKGEVVLDGMDVAVEGGSTVDVHVGTKHRIGNTGDEPLTFIEVQYGTYFGEDDIVRFDDDYGRVS